MGAFLIRRVFTIIPTLLAMTLMVFVIMQSIPGSPFDPAAYGGNDISPEALASIEAKYGLNDAAYIPLYYSFAVNMFKPYVSGIPSNKDGLVVADNNIYNNMKGSLYITDAKS